MFRFILIAIILIALVLLINLLYGEFCIFLVKRYIRKFLDDANFITTKYNNFLMFLKVVDEHGPKLTVQITFIENEEDEESETTSYPILEVMEDICNSSLELIDELYEIYDPDDEVLNSYDECKEKIQDIKKIRKELKVWLLDNTP